MKSSTAFVILVSHLVVTLAESNSSSRTPRRTREEEETRYEKPFAIIVTALFLAVAPVLGRFFYSLVTDPIVPMLLTGLKLKGKQILVEKFGNLEQTGGSAGK